MEEDGIREGRMECMDGRWYLYADVKRYTMERMKNLCYFVLGLKNIYFLFVGFEELFYGF